MYTLQQRFISMDATSYYWIVAGCRLPALLSLGRLLSKLGDGGCYLLGGMLLAWLETERGGQFLVAGVLAFAIELPLYVLLKNSLKRDRPCDRFEDIIPFITPSDKFSLPSGHAAAAFVFASLLDHFYPAWAPLAYAIASLIALSRVLLGVHYPSDIIAGAGLGIGCAASGLALFGLLLGSG